MVSTARVRTGNVHVPHSTPIDEEGPVLEDVYSKFLEIRCVVEVSRFGVRDPMLGCIICERTFSHATLVQGIFLVKLRKICEARLGYM
jgi:hypothetical protein